MVRSLPAPGFVFGRLDPLFYTPVLSFRLAEAARLNPLLLAEIAAIRAGDPGLARSNRDGWHSRDDLFERTEPALARRAGLLRDAIAVATRQIAPGSDDAGLTLECQGWINVNPPGAFNTPHDHPGWYWSGAYYVATPEAEPAAGGADATAGCIEFLDGRTNLRILSQIDAPCMASKVLYRPDAGTLLLFPSHLRHWVYPNAASEDRVSIAINARHVRRAPAVPHG